MKVICYRCVAYIETTFCTTEILSFRCGLVCSDGIKVNSHTTLT